MAQGTGKGVSRREFLKTVVITAGAVQAASLIGCGSEAGEESPFSFPQSVVSGDPRTDSIVLWTRSVSTMGGDVNLTVEVATDASFAQKVSLSTSALVARETSDNCVRAKIVGLTAGTRYYYRFIAAAPAGAAGMGTASATSRVGRFKTAPAAGTDVAVRFGFLSCQDYYGRYYNTLLELLDPAQDDLDFVIHLGDYIYETTIDNLSMATGGRQISFSDPSGAIPLGSGTGAYFAAKSVSNYRDIYKAYRSDPTMQKVHEKFPYIVIWDDHEFSDDCWGDVATYTNGLKDETDAERRRNAEQVYFEYMPLALDAETGTGQLALTRDSLYPNTKLYRDFRFGKNLHLILTDYRSFRPDHLIPEDAFPGSVAMGETATGQVLGTLTAPQIQVLTDAKLLRRAINLNDSSFAALKPVAHDRILAAYLAAGADMTRATALTDAALSGLIDTAVLNTFLDEGQRVALNIGDGPLLSWNSLGKGQLFAQFGGRYLVAKPTYDIYAAYARSQGKPDNPYGDVQSEWLDGRLEANADATWKVLGSSVSMAQETLDLTMFGGVLNGLLPATTVYFNVDQWDGFVLEREDLLTKLRAKNVVVISGDIHAAVVSDYGADGDGNRAVELTGPSVSSTTVYEGFLAAANSIPQIQANPALAGAVQTLADGLNTNFAPDGSPTKFVRTDYNGVVTVRVDGTKLEAVYALINYPQSMIDLTASPATLAPRIIRTTVRVPKTGGKNGPLTIT